MKHMEETNPKYPDFFRLENRAIKRDSDTAGIEVIVPVPGRNLPTAHGPVTFPDKERFDEAVNKMTACDKEKYEEYLVTFFQAAEQNRTQFRSVREKRYAAAKGLE